MAAGDTTLVAQDGTGKVRHEYWEIVTDGSGTAVIYTTLSTVIAVSSAWLEDIGATPTVCEFVIDNSAHTVTVTTANTTNIDKKLSVTLIGW